MFDSFNNKTISIESLNDYLDFIDEIDYNNFYFRGESKHFTTRTASAHRDYSDNLWCRPQVDFDSSLLRYYQEIGNTLNDSEKENFIAYAQHHGLLTPLIDISSSPLTALFFGSENSNNKTQNDYGYIYIFNKSNSIDISSSLRGYENIDLLDNLINLPSDFFSADFYNGLQKIRITHPELFGYMFYDLLHHVKHFDDLDIATTSFVHPTKDSALFIIDKISNLLSDFNFFEINRETYCTPYSEILKHINDNFSLLSKNSYFSFDYLLYKDKDLKQNLIEFNDYFFSSNKNKLIKYKEDSENLNIVMCKNIDELDTAITSYIFILKNYLSYLREQAYAFEHNNLPLLPYFTYTPTFLFDRMKAQKGLFYYQLTLNKFDRTYNTHQLIQQKFIPDYIVKINNKEKIRHQLEMIDINLKTLFPDPDNIAKYLNNLHIQNIKKELKNMQSN